MKRFVFCFLIVHACIISAYAQANVAPGNWGMYFGQFRIKGNWYLHNEFQYRSYEVKPNAEQLLMRAGLVYQIKDNLYVAAGYGKILNYAFDKDVNDDIVRDENRIWEQLIIRHKFSRLFFEHRFRLEQRWVKETSISYMDRLRYLIRINLPLNAAKIEDNTFYVSAYNETFLNFKKHQPFDRNRLYGAVGYQINSAFNFQVGYLNQYVNQSNHYLQFAWMCNVDFRKNSKKPLPVLKSNEVAVN